MSTELVFTSIWLWNYNADVCTAFVQITEKKYGADEIPYRNGYGKVRCDYPPNQMRINLAFLCLLLNNFMGLTHWSGDGGAAFIYYFLHLPLFSLGTREAYVLVHQGLQ